jgi:hypothetical protein
VALAQLLARERRTEISVAIANQNERSIRGPIIELPIARTTSGSRPNAGGAALFVPQHQPLDLTHRQVQTLSGQPRLEHPVHHGLDHLESVEFAHVQRHPFGWLHGEPPSLNRKLPASHQRQNTTFLSCSNTTLGYCLYT